MSACRQESAGTHRVRVMMSVLGCSSPDMAGTDGRTERGGGEGYIDGETEVVGKRGSAGPLSVPQPDAISGNDAFTCSSSGPSPAAGDGAVSDIIRRSIIQG